MLPLRPGAAGVCIHVLVHVVFGDLLYVLVHFGSSGLRHSYVLLWLFSFIGRFMLHGVFRSLPI